MNINIKNPQQNTSKIMFIAALFTRAKRWKQLKFIDRWLDEQNMVYTYIGVLFNLKKEGNSDTCYSIDEPLRYYAKWNKPVTKGQILYGPLTWGT